MFARFYREYGRVIEWGLGLWALSLLIGAIAAYFLQTEMLLTIVTASDAMVILLLLPWLLGAALGQSTRRAQMQAAMARTWQGASYEAVQRDFAEAMDPGRSVGSFSAYAALSAVVVAILDGCFRALFDVGGGILPLLG